MKTIKIDDSKIIKNTIKELEKGGLIIFPTETAYGVAVDATNSDAVSKLLEYKKRPQGKAISVGVSDIEMANEYVEINETAKNIYKQFLPGPVTVISKSKGKVDKRLESEGSTLGIRIPAQDTILQIIKAYGKPITTTSANSSGKKTPYSIDDVLENLSKKQTELIDLIIDGGQLPKRLTSTVIDTTTEDLKTYRQGEARFEKSEVIDECKSASADETILLGEKFMFEHRKSLDSKPILFLLHGDLGAGKTHFTKGIAKALGIIKNIKSPTYTYVEEYKIDSGKLFHIDAWKIENKSDLETLGFESWLKKGNVLVIEWPEIIQNLGQEFSIDADIIDLEFVVGSSVNERILKERGA
ncbi:threonylcarbamoyl-AMP synthase [Candidatus Dojkabacteria bacterium]|uniref:L-threonylcarbamoyladenylate synthase n=1 Tax=Candidatus Dojkabacteria bacterium TaxID=2099670 RepID=A0A955L235_9BACT|nr:threonylcarbamoyl-AMP synthase [Candidatus Dojkabacteria bacterium]